MTLLVGILCEDGAVIAADRQLTQGLVGTSSSKIQHVNNNTLFAASGPVGVGQQVDYVLRQSHPKFGETDYGDAVIQMQPVIQNSVLGPNYAIPHKLGEQIAFCECFFASVFKDGFKLAYMNGAGNFTQLTKGHSFHCLGSGALNGMAILSVIRSALFSEGLPSLDMGILVATSTVKIAIDLRSPGVGFNVDVGVLRRVDEKTAIVEEISPEQLSEHVDLIEWAKKQLIAARDTLSDNNLNKNVELPPKRRGNSSA